jgi:hypothetical protein
MKASSLFASAAAAAAAKNMNGEYMVTSGGDVGAKYNSDYGSKGYEYFDVWGTIIFRHTGVSTYVLYSVTYVILQALKLQPTTERFSGPVRSILGDVLE